jgi:hypothetical protein
MPPVSGSRFGPYEILGPLGAGGMGEVFRARDARLGREVAIKVLPAELAHDAERLRRFEQEARAASALNHPSIVTVYDVGSVDGTSYLAMELVAGRSLRALLDQGAVPLRRLLDVSVQLADGLAKAHASGIVHRDLKPENVMISSDGFVKILDFGIAKLTAPGPGGEATGATTLDPGTVPGTVIGTVGYMSPEQASGQPVDFRSDQFSLGSILYEMGAGRRAFQRATSAETLTAIIREEPEPLGKLAPSVPAPLRWIVERCLAKDADERYASTRDLARDLKSVREHLSEASAGGTAGVVPAEKRRTRPAALAGALVGGLVLGGAAVGLFARRSATVIPTMRQITFRRGTVWRGRIAPDGRVVYSADWDGAPPEIFENRPGGPESRPLGITGADILAVSPSGDLAVSLRSRVLGPFSRAGTLATLSAAAAGAPREILDDVQEADFLPDGKSLAIVRDMKGRGRLELPAGHVVYETDGWISCARVLPDGERVAFLDHPVGNDNGGSVALVDRAGKKKTLTRAFDSLNGLAVSKDGREIFFTAAEGGANQAVYAVTPSGTTRLVYRIPGQLVLLDIGRDGGFLVNRDIWRIGMVGVTDGKERDLSWLDWSVPVDITKDNTRLLFGEAAEGGGPGYSVYVRGLDGSPAVRLGDGFCQTFSADDRWVLAILHPSGDAQLVVYPSGAGEMRMLAKEGLTPQLGDWLPDGKTLLITASEPGHGVRLYLRDLAGGKPRPVSPEGFRQQLKTVSPDGTSVLAIGPDQRVYRVPFDGGAPVLFPGLEVGEQVSRLSADGRIAYVYRRDELPMHVYKLEVATSRRELWKELRPGDAAGVLQAGRFVVTQDGRTYVYSYQRQLSELFQIDGLK